MPDPMQYGYLPQNVPRNLAFIAFGIAFYLSSATPAQSFVEVPKEAPPIVLAQGEQRLLRIPGLKRFSFGSPIVKALPNPSSLKGRFSRENETLLIKGVTPGITDLWIWKGDTQSEHRTIRVEKILKGEVPPSLERALGHLSEAEVLFTGKGVTLRGEIHSLAESARLAAIARSFPEGVSDETHLSEDLLKVGTMDLENWLKKTGLQTTLRLERVGDQLWIRGNVSHLSIQKSTEQQARGIFPAIHTEITSMPDHAPTVYFRVFLLELRKNSFHQLGLNWPSSINTSLKISSSGVQHMTQLDFTLQALEGQGNAKILSKPELVVRAPGEAELFAGGELPIQTTTVYLSNVMWKKFGLTLKLKVFHVSGNQVRLDIFTEVSHLSGQSNVTNIPGVQANRMTTQVDAQFGKPLFLSGLLQDRIREEAKGLPFLSTIPVLGSLFGSNDYLNERSELVAILYPHSAPPLAHPSKKPLQSPLGPLPPARNWVSPEGERFLRESKDFPWNALD